jgi:hypothetical protein
MTCLIKVNSPFLDRRGSSHFRALSVSAGRLITETIFTMISQTHDNVNDINFTQTKFQSSVGRWGVFGRSFGKPD